MDVPSVVGSMGTGVVVVFDEELTRSQGEDLLCTTTSVCDTRQ